MDKLLCIQRQGITPFSVKFLGDLDVSLNPPGIRHDSPAGAQCSPGLLPCTCVSPRHFACVCVRADMPPRPPKDTDK